jgi:cystathionine beta-lyase
MFNFDAPISRQHTYCEKYDGRMAKFGRDDVIPLWVADMDFAAPPCVQEALARRLAHPVLGYSFAPDSLYEALYAWFARRHAWQIDPAQVMLTPGVVPSLFASVQALTAEGDGVIVPTPVYPPFFAAVERSQRRLLACPLKMAGIARHKASCYELDFERLEELAPNAKMILLCSPHNPIGRVWSQEELARLIDIALCHHLIIVSDDIHCDLVLRTSNAERPAPSAPLPAIKHTPLATLTPKELRLVTAIAPSKTFNIPGLNGSALVVSHTQDRRAISQVLARLPVSPFNPLTMTAFEAAYAGGEAWLEALLPYLSANRNWVIQTLADSPIAPNYPEATALMWLDCRALGKSNAELKQFFVQQAGLGLNDGLSFGANGEGFMRLNIGTQQAVLAQALAQLRAALSALS